MPTPPYAKLLVQVNTGALQSGAIYPSVGDTILLSGESVAFWQQQRFEVYDFPEGFAVPAGWTDAGNGTYFYATDPYPPAFVATPWGKFMLRLVVNRGLNGAGKLDQGLTDASTALSIPSTNLALSDLGFLESNQFNAEREWTGDEKKNLRLIDAFTATVPSGLSSATPQPVATSGSAGVSTLASRGDHTHALTFAPVQSALAAASGTITVNNHKISSLATPTASTDATTKAYVDTGDAVVTALIPLPGNGILNTAGTWSVKPHADGSIDVGAAGVQVGVLASDAQHGSLGGGSLHADVVTGGASGFMTGAQATKLAGITSGANVLSVGATLPVTSTGGSSPVIAINPASGVAAGSMSLADFTKVAGLPGVGFATGGLLYSFTSSTYDFVAAFASGNVLLSNGASTPPSYGKVNLSVHVTGALPADNGGTGFASYMGGDLLCASGSTTMSVVSDVALGSVLLSGGVGSVPGYGKVNLALHVAGALPVANGGTNIASYATGDLLIASGAATLVALNVGATGTVLHGGATPSYSVVSLTVDVAGVLPAANGGSGQSAYAIGDLLYASGSAALSKLPDVVTGNVLLSGGITTAPLWGKVDLTAHVTGTLAAGNGGTGATSLGAALSVSGGALAVSLKPTVVFMTADTVISTTGADTALPNIASLSVTVPAGGTVRFECSGLSNGTSGTITLLAWKVLHTLPDASTVTTTIFVSGASPARPIYFTGLTAGTHTFQLVYNLTGAVPSIAYNVVSAPTTGFFMIAAFYIPT